MSLAAASRPGLIARIDGLPPRYRYFIATIDQILLSLFNFGLNIVLLRVLRTSEYGVVVLWLAIAALTVSTQNAFVTTPLSVYVAPVVDDDARRAMMEASIGTINLGLTLLIAAIVFVVVEATDAAWGGPPGLIAALAITAFIATGLFREYMRGLAFSRRSPAQVILIDGPYLAVTSVALVVMAVDPARFGGLTAAFLAMSAGCVASILVAWPKISDLVRFRPKSLDWYRTVLGEVNWSFLGVLVNHLQTRSYVYLVTSLGSLAALGTVNAVGTLYRPAGLFVTAWERSARPDLAALLAERRIGALVRQLARPLVLVALANTIWGVALMLAWAPLDHYILGGKIANGNRLLLPWAVASTVAALRYIVGVCLQAAREFRFLLNAQLVSATVSVVATAAILMHSNYVQVMWGTAAGEGAALIIQGWRLRGVLARIGATPVEAASA